MILVKSGSNGGTWFYFSLTLWGFQCIHQRLSLQAREQFHGSSPVAALGVGFERLSTLDQVEAVQARRHSLVAPGPFGTGGYSNGGQFSSFSEEWKNGQVTRGQPSSPNLKSQALCALPSMRDAFVSDQMGQFYSSQIQADC